MSGNEDSRRRRRRPRPGGKRALIDAAAKAAFLAALRDGAGVAGAAAAAGFTAEGFYTARGRDPAFRLAWTWAMELSAADAARERAGRGQARRAAAGDARIAPNNRRRLQRRAMRQVKFTDARKQVFLDHFAGTCDAEAATAAAGVDKSTVYKHRQHDPQFAAGWERALQQGFAQLEAEALRQRIEAQGRLREGLAPKGEITAEFERLMQLMQRWDRRGGEVGARFVRHGHQRGWTFDEAIAALDRKLRALGARHGIVPPEDAGAAADPAAPASPGPSGA